MTHLPVDHPLRQIHAAIMGTVAARNAHPIETWTAREIDAVAAVTGPLAESLGVPAPSRRQLELAEIFARGHADFVTGFAVGAYKVLWPNGDNRTVAVQP